MVESGLAQADVQAYVTATGNAIYFSSSVRIGAGKSDIWRAPLLDVTGTIATPEVVLGGVNTADDEVAPVLPADELTIFFRRGVTEYDIYTASRSAITDGFGAATPVPGAAEPGVGETPAWISPDGCHLYLYSDAPNGQGKLDLYMMTRE